MNLVLRYSTKVGNVQLTVKKFFAKLTGHFYLDVTICDFHLYLKMHKNHKDVKRKLRENFERLSQHTLFYVDIDREEIWNLYLEGFDDPVARQAHNCNACKSFLRQW
jgi:hypothetical protein